MTSYPLAGGVEGIPRSWETQVQKAVWLPRITYLFGVDPGIPKSSCIGSSFVAEPITTAENDQGGGEASEARGA